MMGKGNKTCTCACTTMVYNKCTQLYTVNVYTEVHLTDNNNILYTIMVVVVPYGVGWCPVGQAWMNFQESQRPTRHDDHE